MRAAGKWLVYIGSHRSKHYLMTKKVKIRSRTAQVWSWRSSGLRDSQVDGVVTRCLCSSHVSAHTWSQALSSRWALELQRSCPGRTVVALAITLWNSSIYWPSVFSRA